MAQRATRQLAAVYDVLAASTDHPTAEMVYQRVRGRMPRVSLGTVYRNLDKLRDHGRLRVVRLAGGEAHYDAMLAEHDHFVCERCGGVHDVTAPAAPRDRLDPRIASTVHWRTTMIYGVCAACAGTAASST
jgi:Fe2+ or Zn2+ uptake regulation protein